MHGRIFDTININKSRARKDTSSLSQRKRIRCIKVVLAFEIETRVDFVMFYLTGLCFLVVFKKKREEKKKKKETRVSSRAEIPFIRVHIRLRGRS